ncbi:hypothetical protein DFQ26_005903 [Actinomortierella ambigua]|nr:hypothetical protein DFQ26_005903 [Actinomortierella ambigua]
MRSFALACFLAVASLMPSALAAPVFPNDSDLLNAACANKCFNDFNSRIVACSSNDACVTKHQATYVLCMQSCL